MNTPTPPRRRFDWRHLLAAVLIAATAGVGVGVAVEDGTVVVRIAIPRITTPAPNSSSSTAAAAKRATPETIAVDGPDADAKPDDPVELTPKAQQVAAGLAVHPRDLVADKPGLPPLAGTGPLGPVARLLPPFAADSLPGCRTRFLPTNWSYRTGNASPSLFWLHYSAAPDIPNSRAEVDGLTAYGSSRTAAVSWHINMDRDGNCDYNVPLRYKAWTEANANSTGISVEVAGTGTAPYLRPAGYRELARIYLELKERYGIPLRLGAVSNCSPTRSGIVTHWMGGPCSGGHVDVKPLAIEAIIRELARYVAAARCDRACQLRAKHRRTHERFRRLECSRKGPRGRVRHGYCDTLRARNAAVHRAAKREHISLAGSYAG